MKVIFLDVDGVLNSDEYIDKIKKLNVNTIKSKVSVNKIGLLKQAVDATGARVVLTSSWRYRRDGTLLKGLLLKYGICADSTPFMDNKRGLEIKKYLLDNPDVEDFVILDDEVFDSFDEELIKHLIKISDKNGRGFGEGLLPKDVDRIIERLGRIKQDKEKQDEFER